MFSSESSGNDDFVSPFFFSFYFVEVDDNADVRAQARGMITSLSFSDPILRVHRDTYIYIYIYSMILFICGKHEKSITKMCTFI